MTHFIRFAADGEIALNGVPLRVVGDVGFEIANNYAKQLAQGDPGPNDHAVDSTITQEDWTGGINVLKYKGDESRGNSWFSTLEMQVLNQLTLQARVDEYTVAGELGRVYVHDKYNGEQWVTFGKKMKRWQEVSQTIADPASGADTSTGTPSGKGVTWGDDTTAKKLYIPMGGANYETWDGANFAVGGETAVAFVVWQQKLFKLGADGSVKFTVDGSTWSLKGFLPNDAAGRSLWIGKDAAGAEVVSVSTAGSTYNLDFTNGLLVETTFQYPEHPGQGWAGTVWRGVPYLSVGIGIHRLADGLITAFGPDNKDGLPEEYSVGFITSMIPTYNELMIAIAGGDIAFTPTAETGDLGISPPEAMYSEATDKFAVVMGNNGLGWHPHWTGEQEPTNLHASSNSGVYRVFWGGANGSLFTRILPIGYYNPRYSQNQTPLMRYGRHITPWYNWGFVDSPKILKELEVKTLDCNENDYIVVWVRFDDFDAEWGDGQSPGTPLAVITSDGQHHLRVGAETLDDYPFFAGEPHERVQFMFEMYGDEDDEYSTPVIEWFTLRGRKWMNAVRIWTAMIDCTAPHKNQSPQIMSQAILAAARKKGGVPFTLAGETFIVDVTTDNGNQEAGLSHRSYHNVTLVETTEFDADEHHV